MGPRFRAHNGMRWPAAYAPPLSLEEAGQVHYQYFKT